MQLPARRAAVVSVVATGYAVVFVAVAAVLLAELLTGSGAIGRDHLAGRAVGGVVELSIVLLAAAATMLHGVYRLRRHGSAAPIAWPLAVFVVVGIIGEIVDLAGTASGASDAIGAGLVVVAAIPLALIVWRA